MLYGLPDPEKRDGEASGANETMFQSLSETSTRALVGKADEDPAHVEGTGYDGQEEGTRKYLDNAFTLR